ncbi:MAG: AtpZ/AtpI family protein [Candidatus Dormibacteria bacterium]
MSLGGDPQRPGGVPGPGAALALVGVFSFTVGVGVVAGVLLDQRWHTLPWLTLTGLVLGMVAGAAAVIRGLRWLRGPGGDG